MRRLMSSGGQQRARISILLRAYGRIYPDKSMKWIRYLYITAGLRALVPKNDRASHKRPSDGLVTSAARRFVPSCRIQIDMSIINKQRVLMHRHQGWNVRHGLCHIYMRYLYIYELFIAFVCFVVCSLLQRDGIFGVLCRKWQARESTGMFGNLMAIYYIMPQFIQNHSRFVMLMKTCMIS